MSGHILVDLDGTLAHSDGVHDLLEIGPSIPEMVAKVRQAMQMGIEIRIFTARVSHPDPQLTQLVTVAVQDWCYDNLGVRLVVTNCKDFDTMEIWDNIAVQVINNTGEFLGDSGVID